MLKNDYDILLELTSDTNEHNRILETIKSVFHSDLSNIHSLEIMKKGITNKSFTFYCDNKKYFMRIPGQNTEQFIDRKAEAEIYHRVSEKNICEDLIYINPETGYKITAYISNGHNCGYYDFDEIKKCMHRLREFHELNITVDNTYDLFHYIQLYEDLWENKQSRHADYEETKSNILSLKSYIDSCNKTYSLTHIDPNPDNFILSTDENGNERIYLIDWEYSAMADPHIDIAMFCIYSEYTDEQIQNIINSYFYDGISEADKLKIYCYIAVSALNFANWCEIKNDNSFNRLSDYMYNTAKKYYAYVANAVKAQEA